MPCYGDLGIVERSLPRLLASQIDALEVLLLNNDSRQSEALQAFVASIGDPRARVVELPHAAGFARAMNVGIAKSAGELVFFANSDLFVTDRYVTQLERFFATHARAGCATGKILRYDVDTNSELDVLDTTGHVIGRDRGVCDRGENNRDRGQYERQEQVFGCSGAALVARRAALESIRHGDEYLDESFFMYKEDVDLSWRFRLTGWECWYVPGAIAYHARTSLAPSGGGLVGGIQVFHRNERAKPRHVRVHSMKNQWLLLVKNEDLANLVRHLPFIVSREAMVIGYNTVFAPRVTISAVRAFARSLPGAIASRRNMAAKRKASPAALRRWFAPRSQSTSVVRRTPRDGSDAW